MNLSVCSGILIKAVISNSMVVFALLSSRGEGRGEKLNSILLFL